MTDSIKGEKMKTRVIFLLLAAVAIILITAQCTSSATPTSAPNIPANTQPVAIDTLTSAPNAPANTQPAAIDTLTSAPNTPANTQPAAATLDGKTLLQDRCTVCHTLDRVTSAHGNATQWKSTVDKMIKNGAQLNADEETALVNYLAQTYP